MLRLALLILVLGWLGARASSTGRQDQTRLLSGHQRLLSDLRGDPWQLCNELLAALPEICLMRTDEGVWPTPARLHEEAPMPIASGEWLTTRHEFAEAMDVGKIAIAQPDVGRVGGLTEARRVCDMAAERGRRIIPHCWKTGISIAASAHLAAVTPHCPYFEFLPAPLTDSLLRQELVSDELQLVDGKIPLPDRPGLGIEVNMDAMRRFEVD